jgi:preprotein translocase SecE subunit
VAVHRYKANESEGNDTAVEPKVAPAKKTVSKKPASSKRVEKSEKKERKQLKIFAPFRALGRYFVGSWRELRQVRWPNRKQTWAMTLAVILFSLALGVLIFLLDAAFTLLFKKFIF